MQQNAGNLRYSKIPPPPLYTSLYGFLGAEPPKSQNLESLLVDSIFNTDFNQTDILFDIDGSTYLYEPGYREEELQEQDERSRRMGEQPAEEVEEDHSRCAGIFWFACGYCEPMGTEAECLHCQECVLFVAPWTQ